ncbi:MAG: carboxylating nicotinate-nucleotide diphosphorylase [Candidatus Burarchaeum sp.]|nr:carboxylating nicotinate-nucleotide diphosphorylase [Candidatus Burarchaeum sp.]
MQDDGAGRDVTSARVPRRACRALIIAQEQCVLAGAEEAAWLFASQGVHCKMLRKDGQIVRAGSAVLELVGENRKILSTERVALNVLGRMSGVASACAEAVREAEKFGKTQIALTRKTSPGFQPFDKKAAVLGGALPHRANLAAMVLLKDNHLSFFPSLSAAIAAFPRPVRAEVEVETMAQALEAAKTCIGAIMLDNFSPSEAKKAIACIRHLNRRVKIELSGGIILRNLRDYAGLGADMISMGSLTKDAPQKDFSLNLITKN